MMNRGLSGHQLQKERSPREFTQSKEGMMLANRVLTGVAVLVLVAMAFFHGTAAGAPLPAPVQAGSSARCSVPIRQQLGTVLPQISTADEEKLCNDLEQPATSSVPTTGGADTTCVARVRQELGTAWPRMASVEEQKICKSFQ